MSKSSAAAAAAAAAKHSLKVAKVQEEDIKKVLLYYNHTDTHAHTHIHKMISNNFVLLALCLVDETSQREKK